LAAQIMAQGLFRTLAWALPLRIFAKFRRYSIHWVFGGNWIDA
jgi:hypothetical protein